MTKPEQPFLGPRPAKKRQRSPADQRAAFFDRAQGRTDYLCVRLGSGRLLVKTEDKHIGRALFIKGGRGDIKVLARSVLTIQALLGEDGIAGTTFIEVGANIGSTTVSAMLSHPFAGALALEPEPENYLALRLNLVLNGIEDRVVALPYAASNVDGALPLVVDRARSGVHWLASGDMDPDSLEGSGSPINVPVVKLDSLVDRNSYDPDRVGLLWIDAENHEAQILEGASELTSRGVPTLFEWDPVGLGRRGDPEKLYEIIGDRYTHYAKMRADTRAGQPRYDLRPVKELRELASTHTHFTDILVVRLAERQVPSLSLGALLRKRRGLSDEARQTGASSAKKAASKPQTGSASG